jgi:Flp pilus assembly protein TadG
MKEERGSILPMFAGLALTSFVMIALVVELALLSATYRVVAGAADAAAESGASMLSVTDAYASELVLDTAAAKSEAMRVVAALSTGDATISISGAQLCVTVSDVYRPTTLLNLGVSAVDVTVQSCAEPRRG